MSTRRKHEVSQAEELSSIGRAKPQTTLGRVQQSSLMCARAELLTLRPLLSYHLSPPLRTDGRTDERTDERTDWSSVHMVTWFALWDTSCTL